MAQLSFTKGNRLLNSVLDGQRTTIGRAHNNDLVLDEGTVSGWHAEIVHQEGGFLLRDLNSSNGTKVNGNRITHIEIKDGDRIVFGSVECVFRNLESDVASASNSETDSPKAEMGTVRKIEEYVFPCNLCGSNLLAAEELNGTQTTCPGCRKRITVPPPDEHSLGLPASQVFRLPRFLHKPSSVCPFCGGKKLKTTNTKGHRISISGDRLCKGCGASWTPPVPKWAAATMLALLLVLFGIKAFIYFGLSAQEETVPIVPASALPSPVAVGPDANGVPVVRINPLIQISRPASSISPFVVCAYVVSLVILAYPCIRVLQGNGGNLTIHKSGVQSGG
jgi:pSer/pThr/pTyr-binding forkhead associated (FHA) protein